MWRFKILNTKYTKWQTVEETPAIRIGSISVVVVFSSFLLFFSGGPGGLSPPEGRFPPPEPDMSAPAWNWT